MTDSEIVLAAGALDGWVEPRAMDEAMALSFGPLPGSDPTAGRGRRLTPAIAPYRRR